MYKRNHSVFHIVDRCVRSAEGKEVPDKERDALLDAHCAIQHGRWETPEVLYCDGEGGLNNEVAQARLAATGAELRIRAPGQRAATSEARSGRQRMTLHVNKEDMKLSNISLNFPRPSSDAMFARSAFTFYNGSSPYNALAGRQPAMMPDLETPGYDTVQTSGGEREAQIRRASIEAITRATAVAKANPAPRARATADGSRMHRECGMVDYRRPTFTKDGQGGWTGPFSVVRNEPDRGQLVVRA